MESYSATAIGKHGVSPLASHLLSSALPSSCDLGYADPQGQVEPDLICFSHLRWDFVTQRPQHLLQRAARNGRVFYWEEPIWFSAGELLPAPSARTNEVDRFENICYSDMSLEIVLEEPQLWVIRPHLQHGVDATIAQRQLLDQLIICYQMKNYTTWYYTPMALAFSSHLTPDVLVYDCMDELTGFVGAPAQLPYWEHELFAAADVVFTGGISLYEAKKKQHKDVHAFPSSIDVAHFSRAKSDAAEEPQDQAEIPHPRAGYYGVIDERFDIALLTEIARLRPAVHFVMLGPVVKIDPASLPHSANIHYMGSKHYSELPFYLAGWDVAILPFARNDATRFISPTKTPEYLAAGKTVISTSIRDVVRTYGETGLVRVADSPAEFAEAIDRSIEPQSASWNLAVATALSRSSWDSTWASMQTLIQGVRSKKGTVALCRERSQSEAASTVGSLISASTQPTNPAIGTVPSC